MGLLDIFKNDAFSVVELTDAFNVWPNTYGRLNELNLFPERGVRTTDITIERKNNVLNILPTAPRGGPASKGTVGKRDLRKIAIPHIPHDDQILADDVQGVRAFGTDNQLMAIQDLVNDKLQTMTAKHDITLEFLRWGALKGHILDADGDTILNLFAEFGVTEEVISFDLSNPNTDVLGKILDLKRYLETHLFGDSMSGVHVMTSPGFFSALTFHPNVKAAYQYFQTTQPLSGDYRTKFVHAGVTFEEHNGSATTFDGTVHKFIPDDEARAFPEGSQSFRTYFAPADFMETVNTPGMRRYAKQRIMDFERGVQIHTQSNPLPICLRPQLLVRLTKD